MCSKFIVVKICFTILTFALAFNAFGQKYHKCSIYQYQGNDSGNKELVCTQIFNERGKIVHDTFTNFGIYVDSVLEPFLLDGICDYYYEDTLLKMKKNYRMTDDSARFSFYIYNESGRLCKELSFYRGRFSDTLFYTYDAWGNLQEINHRDFTRTYSYDRQGRLLKESVAEGDYPITTFEYAEHSSTRYFEIDRFTTRKFVAISDRKKRVIEEDTYSCRPGRFVPEYNSKGEFLISSYKYWGHHADMSCRLLSKDFTTYDREGRIAKKIHWRDNEITTTHIYVYE